MTVRTLILLVFSLLVLLGDAVVPSHRAQDHATQTPVRTEHVLARPRLAGSGTATSRPQSTYPVQQVLARATLLAPPATTPLSLHVLLTT